MNTINKIIWIYWHQGWDNAPEIPQKCLSTWISKNPGWEVRNICSQDLNNFIDLEEEIPGIEKKEISFASLSDIIRICLLEKYGGIWADSTMLCRIPLDEWLVDFTHHDFFAFSKPTPDRLVASWFLMAKNESYIIRVWHKKTKEYWQNRLSSDDYFWFHHLFNDLFEEDQTFHELWEDTPHISADDPHYFSIYERKFFETISPDKIRSIERLQTPVFKLTHKYDQRRDKKGTALEYLLTSDPVVKKMKLLVAWYGSFEKNGTIGDYLSVKSLTHFLAGKNFDFDCACYKEFEGLKGNIVNLEETRHDQYNALIYCCGPIIRTHPKTNSLFHAFHQQHKIGIGVSLFPSDHSNFINPFDFILARENGDKDYEDIAIIAPENPGKTVRRKKGINVGLVLRNEQHEYGAENCRHKQANSILLRLAKDLIRPTGGFFSWLFKSPKEKGTIIKIDNHLESSGMSPDEIEKLYQRCDIVLTTRYHGSMLALRNNIPFIAIDQIFDGAKVYKLVSRMGYPFVWKINEVEYDIIKKHALELLKKKYARLISSIRHESCRRASKTLQELEIHLNSWSQ
jgi:hypothetical protein